MKNFIFSFFLVFILILPLHAQLKVTGSSYSIKETSYIKDTVQDPVFIINGKIGEELSVTLQADHPVEGTEATYTWYRFDPVSFQFDSLHTETNVSFSQHTDNLATAYLVRVQDKSGLDTSFTSWVFFNYLSAKFDLFSHVCYILEMKVSVEQMPEQFIYYDLADSSELKMPYDYGYTWTAIGDEKYDEEINVPYGLYFFDNNPPAVNTTYRFTVTDSFENSTSIEKYLETKETYAKFIPDAKYSYEIVNKNFSEQVGKSAPVAVTYKNESKNGDK
ncbi:MAG: hypothetical protein ACOCVN_00505, partial [bacterium]